MRRCCDCGAESSGGGVRCAGCRGLQRRRRAERVAAGLCARSGCGRPAAPGVCHCGAHHAAALAYSRAYKARRRAARVDARAVADVLDDYDAVL